MSGGPRLYVLMLPLLLLACSDGGEARRAERPAQVRALLLTVQEARQTLNVVGHVRPSAAVRVTAQVSGQLLRAEARPGSQVKEGDLLFQIDPRSFRSSLNQAEAALSSSRAQLRRAQQDMARYGQLASQNFLSRQQYEQSQLEVETLRAAIDQNTAILENAALQLEHTSIRAPISGRAGELLVDPGNNIKANDSILLVINTISPALVSFSVPERFLPELNRRLRAGKVEALALPEGDKGPPVSGYLVSIDNEVDSSTGAVSLRARFDNADERLWPGQFVRVSVIMEAVPEALIVPESAVLEGLTGRYVYVLGEDGRVSDRAIEGIELDGGRVMVSHGLSAGETVITDGQLNLLPGGKAEVISAPASPAPAS